MSSLPTSGMKDLVRNPLGIVALFISLIYGVASLLLGATAGTLLPEERTPLIAFVTLFPLVVLGVFYLLVTRHHGKLYAPGDFKNDASFLRTLSKEEAEQRRRSEVVEELSADQASDPGNPTDEVKQQQSSKAADSPAPDAASKASDIPSLSQLFAATQRAEVGAIAQLEREFGEPASRNVEIANAGVSFDAFLTTKNKPTFAEVKLLTNPAATVRVLDRVLYNALVADRALSGKFKLVLVAVYTFPRSQLARVESLWRRRVERCPADIDLRFVSSEDVDA